MRRADLEVGKDYALAHGGRLRLTDVSGGKRGRSYVRGTAHGMTYRRDGEEIDVLPRQIRARWDDPDEVARRATAAVLAARVERLAELARLLGFTPSIEAYATDADARVETTYGKVRVVIDADAFEARFSGATFHDDRTVVLGPPVRDGTGRLARPTVDVAAGDVL